MREGRRGREKITRLIKSACEMLDTQECQAQLRQTPSSIIERLGKVGLDNRPLNTSNKCNLANLYQLCCGLMILNRHHEARFPPRKDSHIVRRLAPQGFKANYGQGCLSLKREMVGEDERQ